MGDFIYQEREKICVEAHCKVIQNNVLHICFRPRVAAKGGKYCYKMFCCNQNSRALRGLCLHLPLFGLFWLYNNSAVSTRNIPIQHESAAMPLQRGYRGYGARFTSDDTGSAGSSPAWHGGFDEIRFISRIRRQRTTASWRRWEVGWCWLELWRSATLGDVQMVLQHLFTIFIADSV